MLRSPLIPRSLVLSVTRRLLLTCSSAAWLIGIYLLYAHLVSPVIEPTQLAGKEPQYVLPATDPEDPRPSEQVAVAMEHLPNHDWVKGADNTFRIGDIYIYANKVEQGEHVQEEGRGFQIRFSPFALVWTNPQAQPGDPPRMRITADRAVIEFNTPFDFLNRDDQNRTHGRPVFGTLEGEVKIEGPNGLQIVGRGFTFSESALRLWSDNDVRYHYGPHHGTGHGLQVDFLPTEEHLATPGQPRLGGIKSAALLREVVLNLVGEEPDPAGQRRSPLKAGDELKVTSDGRMQYDMEASLITFDHNVKVRHPLPDEQEEGLDCDLLTLVLAAASKDPMQKDPSRPQPEIAQAANEVPAAGQGFADWLPGKLEVTEIRADDPGKQRVQFFSKPRDLQCNAAQIEYDLQKRLLTMRDPATVDVLQGANELHSPEVILTLDDNNRDVRQAIARGTGSANTRLNDGRTVTARWKKQLIKTLDPATHLDIVELQGAASVTLGLDYELSGDALRVWTTPLATGAAFDADPAVKSKKGAPPPRVERVAGVGQVVLRSPQASAHTRRLDVTFKPEPLPPEAAKQQNTLFGFGQPDSSSPRSRVRQRGPQRTPAAPLDITAETVTAVVSRDPVDEKRMALSELWADHSLTVTQPLKPGEPALQMLGQHLHVQSLQPAQQLVKLTGSPAQIKSGQSRLEGRDIRMDRQQNSLKVVGAGVLNHAVSSGMNGQQLERPQILQVKWAEKLDFNGQTAEFFEKVEAKLEQTTMHCSEMHVTLLNPVRFSDPQLTKLSANRLQVARIECENKVEIESSEHQGNIIISRSRGSLGHFVVDNITGKTEAMGPGYFREWRRGQQRTEAKPSSKGTRSQQPQSKNLDWTYSRIDFQGLMKGNVHERFTTFEDHVEIVYGPVAHATDIIDPEELDGLPEGAAAITCDTLNVEQFPATASAAAYIRLSAVGNTKMEMEYDGDPFHARADEVKFDESNDFYLLRSIGGQKVEINRQPTTENPDGHMTCGRVEIYRRQRKIKFLHLTGLDGVQ